jgi:O-antigen ligase
MPGPASLPRHATPRRLAASAAGRPAVLVGMALLVAVATGAAAGVFGGLLALAGLVFLAFLVAAIADYRAGILIALMLLPLSATYLMPREMFGVTGFNPFNVTLAMAMVPLALMLMFQRAEIVLVSLPRPFWAYFVLVLCAALHGALRVSSIPEYFSINQIISFDTPGGYLRDVFMKPMLIVITAWLLSVAVRNARRPQAYLVVLFASSIILPIAVLVHVATAGVSMSTLASGNARGFLSVLGMHANEMGFMFNMAFALGMFSFFGMRNGLGRLLLGMLLVVLTAAVVLTFSRGAFLGYLSVVLYFLFRQRQFSVLLAGLMLLAVAAILVPQAVIERIGAGAHSGSMDAISAGRMDGIWRPLLPEVLGSPLVGNGLSSILWSDAARQGLILRVGHPHSAYLGVLLDFGLVGVVVVAWFYHHMWRTFAKAAKRSANSLWQGYFTGGTACILLLLVQGSTDDRFMPTAPQIYLWLSYGIALGLRPRAASSIRQGPDAAGHKWLPKSHSSAMETLR